MSTHSNRIPAFIRRGLGLTLFAFAGVAFGAVQGCTAFLPDMCTEPTPCANGVDLEVENCFHDGYLFSDGKTREGGSALMACQCVADVECVDGTTASICPSWGDAGSAFVADTEPLPYGVTFEDGTRLDLEEGLAACLGYSECEDAHSVCNPGHFVLSCDDGAAWVGRGGAEFDIESSARRFCGGESFEEASKFCQQVAPCEDLSEDECSDSEACRADPISGVCELGFLGGCEDVHDSRVADPEGCNADAACSWE